MLQWNCQRAGHSHALTVSIPRVMFARGAGSVITCLAKRGNQEERTYVRGCEECMSLLSKTCPWSTTSCEAESVTHGCGRSRRRYGMCCWRCCRLHCGRCFVRPQRWTAVPQSTLKHSGAIEHTLVQRCCRAHANSCIASELLPGEKWEKGQMIPL